MRLSKVICYLVLAATPAAAQGPFSPDATVEALLQELVDGDGVKGVVVGLLDETGTHRVIAHGDPGPGAPPLDRGSVFEIGSMTKVFTGILLADMVRRGEVELADALEDLVPPDVRVPERNKKPITLLDLAWAASRRRGSGRHARPSRRRQLPAWPWAAGIQDAAVASVWTLRHR